MMSSFISLPSLKLKHNSEGINFNFLLKASLDLGTDRFGFGFGGTGKKSNNRNFDDYGEPFGKCDVIGCCLNLDDMEVRFCKNGVDLGSAFKLPASLKSTAFFPAVVLKNAEMQFNFGDEKFKHEPPSGYIPICQANRAENNSVKGQGSKQQKILPNAPQAIILEPSRELAEQTYNNLKKFGTHLNSPTVKGKYNFFSTINSYDVKIWDITFNLFLQHC